METCAKINHCLESLLLLRCGTVLEGSLSVPVRLSFRNGARCISDFEPLRMIIANALIEKSVDRVVLALRNTFTRSRGAIFRRSRSIASQALCVFRNAHLLIHARKSQPSLYQKVWANRCFTPIEWPT
jgi:hypothetical protein